MYLNLGNNTEIRERDIVGIFDTDNATVSQITRAYLTGAEKNGLLRSQPGELPKSFILCREKNGCRVYFSKFSAAALLGRTDTVKNTVKHK